MPPARRRYQLKHPELNQAIEALVERATAVYERQNGAEPVRQMIVSALRLLREDRSEGELKLLNNALKELRHTFQVFAPYQHTRKVAVFGSARTPEGHPDWEQAHGFAERMASEGWMVITGAGDGIMGAAQGGAGREASFGVNIRLPFEQRANEVIAGDHKLINFRYFFTRKVTFVKEAHAIALFPGGFGTHDEGFEALTLMQTGKSELVPVVYIDEPGGSYWSEWAAYVDSHLRERGLIGEHDQALFKVTDDVGVAVDEIRRFYRNYHSSRYVDDLLVIRLRQVPDADQLEELNEEFSDIVAKDEIEVGEALAKERGEVAELPRLTLHFDRRSVGRLRVMIDQLNALAAPAPTARDASPHEIVPQELSDEAEQAEEAEED